MSKQNKARLLLDLGTFISLLIVSAPHFTGDAIHEWLGVALSGAIVVHLLLNWNWIVEISARLFTQMTTSARISYILNWALFATGIMITLSGLMISKTVVPFFGWSLPADMSWRQLHELSTNLIMILMGLHVALHWNWIMNMFKRLFMSRASVPVTNPAISLQGRKARS